jgi:hypothetical protein
MDTAVKDNHLRLHTALPFLGMLSSNVEHQRHM